MTKLNIRSCVDINDLNKEPKTPQLKVPKKPIIASKIIKGNCFCQSVEKGVIKVEITVKA